MGAVEVAGFCPAPSGIGGSPSEARTSSTITTPVVMW